MSTQFFPKLSRNYIEILDDDEYYDITIEVGKDPNVRIFRGHMNILCYRSPYFRRTLANKKKNEGTLTSIKLPDFSPEYFQMILKYIYGGIISLDEQDISNILNVMRAADELHLQELVEYLQKYLIEKKDGLLEQHFELAYRTSFLSNSFLELQKFCIDVIVKSPDKVFKSLDFTSLPEKSLISLIKRDDLQMKEVEVWKHVLKWGLEKHPTLILDPITWSDDDFKMMGNTLQNCLPSVRFFSLSSEEFIKNVHPYKRLLRNQLYEDLLNSHLDPNSKPSDGILLPRFRNLDGIIDTKIVNLNIVSIISRWIEKLEIKSNFAHVRELYLPYKFKLLLRGSRDGMTPKKFHELCDNIPYTVTFIKVKGTEEILGGYNPSIWKESYLLFGESGQTKDSFIFSFKNKDNLKDSILSHVNIKHKDQALFYHYTNGPTFSDDLLIDSLNGENDYYRGICRQKRYDKMIRDTEDFKTEDYEIFQILEIDAM